MKKTYKKPDLEIIEFQTMGDIMVPDTSFGNEQAGSDDGEPQG